MKKKFRSTAAVTALVLAIGLAAGSAVTANAQVVSEPVQPGVSLSIQPLDIATKDLTLNVFAPDVPLSETREDREEYFRELETWRALYYYEGNTDSFNALAYYVNYADLQQVFGADPDALFLHYQTNGAAEGRAANMVISPYGTFALTTNEANAYETVVVFHGYMEQVVRALNIERAANGRGAVVLDTDMCFQDCVFMRNNYDRKSSAHHDQTVSVGSGIATLAHAGIYQHTYEPTEGHRVYLLQPGVTRAGVSLRPVDGTFGYIYGQELDTIDEIRDAYVNSPYILTTLKGSAMNFDIWLQ